ncbi:MAG: SDR family oxidoreductase [Candidatus Lokiarchaeota archaeon]|nr:SDR family oxidoreductase [Candidatus Lokiarchaeota archaeon]
MKLSVFGGTGRTGRWILKEGLERGHEIVALVRSPEKVLEGSPRLQLVDGSPTSLDDVRRAVKGADAVLSALNVNRSSDLPWARVTSPKDLMSTSIKNALEAMHEEHVKRIVVVSAYGVGETKEKIGALGRLFLYGTNIKYAYLDHERQERLLAASDLDWTALRPTFLKGGQETRAVIASIDGVPKPKGSVSRRNLARFMLDCAEKGLHVRQAPTVSQE